MQVNPSSPVSLPPKVVRRPSTPTTSTSGAVSGAGGAFVPSVQPPISANHIQLMVAGNIPGHGIFSVRGDVPYANPTTTVDTTTSIPSNDQHLPAWVEGCSFPTYGTLGSLNCELDPQLTAGYSLMAAGVIPGHGIFSLQGQLPYASTNTVDTTITIPPSGEVQINLNNPVQADHDRSLAGCVRKAMTYFRLCLVPQNAGPAATLGQDYTGAIKNPWGMVDAQQLANQLNGPSGPECATVYRGVDPSVPGTTVTAFGEDLYVHNSCDVAVGPGGPVSSRNVEKLSNGGVRLHYRPVPPSVPTSGPTSEKWQGAQVSTVRADFKYGNYSMEIGGIPAEQTREERGIIRAIFSWSDQPRLDQLKPDDKL